MSTEAPDDFAEHIKRQVLDAYGFDSETELDAAIEEQLPGYLAAHAEWEAEKAAFTAELQSRAEEAQRIVATFFENFTVTLSSACESVLTLARTLRQEPWPHGWNEPCFCHPKPFPAARDYRRRTRHRNRRRKS